MNVYLSIVLAVYNAEKTIERMVNSILRQTYKEFELIIVDDGSTDNTPSICDRYELKDSRITVIHQDNQGSVVARQNGLKKSKGVYISFVDGDDWIEEDYYQRMLYNSNDADVIVSGYVTEKEEVCDYLEHTARSGFYKDELLDELHKNLLCGGYYTERWIYPALWNKVFKKELILSLNLEISASIKMGDDACVSYPVMFNAKSIYVCNDIKSYHYCVNASSMSKAYDKEYFSRIEQVYRWFCIWTKNISVENIEEQLSGYMFFLIRMGIYQELYRGNFFSLIQNFVLLNRHIKSDWINEAICHVDKSRFLKADEMLYRSIKKQSITLWGLREYVKKLIKSFL